MYVLIVIHFLIAGNVINTVSMDRKPYDSEAECVDANNLLNNEDNVLHFCIGIPK